MTTHVAFLRAINLGARRRFGKDDVAAVTSAAGFADVTTHLDTGNVRLTTTMRSCPRIATVLEAAYLADRGFEVPTVVLARAELRAVVADVAELDAVHLRPGGRHYVSLLRTDPDPVDVAALEARGTPEERVVVRGRAVHLLLGESYRAARLTNAVVERHLGVATNRSAGVLATIVAKWC